MIGVFAEERFGREKSLRANPLRSQTGRRLKELKETVSHDAAPPRDSKVERFSDDVITRYNHPPSLCQLSHEQRRVEMMRTSRASTAAYSAEVSANASPPAIKDAVDLAISEFPPDRNRELFQVK